MGKIRGIRKDLDKDEFTMSIKENRHKIARDAARKLLKLSLILNGVLLLTTFMGAYLLLGTK